MNNPAQKPSHLNRRKALQAVALTPATAASCLTGAASAATPAINVFQTFAAYLTQLNTVINGTNTVQKLVAVGHWSPANNTFTAYRIDIVQLP